MKIKTTKKLAEAIKKQDAQNAINANMLKSLFEDKVLTSWKVGNRTVSDLLLLIREINQLFGLEDKEQIPKVRSIHNAYVSLKDSNPDLGISEERIRLLVVKGKIPHIRIGNRAYIALEIFDPPYDKCLVYDDFIDSSKVEIERVVQNQFEQALARRNKRR